MSKGHDLVSLWRSCNLDAAPTCLGQDWPIIENVLGKEQVVEYRSLNKYMHGEFGAADDRKLHLGLLPQPYVGNLKNARLFILMLNPGLGTTDYLAEEEETKFRGALKRNIRQENGADEFPFLWLDPQFAWHGGFQYFHKRLAPIVRKLAGNNMSYVDALRVVSRATATLELVPYHSRSFGARKVVEELPSTLAMLEFVHGQVLPRAAKGDALVLVTRAAKLWAIGKSAKNVSVFGAGEARGAYLGRHAEQICSVLTNE